MYLLPNNVLVAEQCTRLSNNVLVAEQYSYSYSLPNIVLVWKTIVFFQQVNNSNTIKTALIRLQFWRNIENNKITWRK